MVFRKKQAYFVIMVLSGLALSVDRFVLSKGVTAPVAVEASPREASAGAADRTEPAAEEAVPAIPEMPFPRGVERFSFGSNIPDMFAPPRSVASDDAAPLHPGKSGGGGEDTLSVRGLKSSVFAVEHELDGVLDHKRLKIAIVDGRWLRIGDELDGCTLSRISGDVAGFECRDGEAVLGPSRPGVGARD